MDENLLLFLSLMLPATMFLGAYDVVGKRLLKTGLKPPLLVGVCFLLSGLILSVVLPFTGIPRLEKDFYPCALAIIAINAFSNLAWYKALNMEEASLLAPTRLLTPPLVLVTGFLFLGEVPGWLGTVGVLTTILGLYMLVSGEAKNDGVSLNSVLKRPGFLLALCCACTGAVTFSLDKRAVLASSAAFFTVVFFLGVGAMTLFIHFVGSGFRTDDWKVLGKNKRLIAVLALVHALGALLSFASLSFTLAAYAASTKRLWSLFSVLLAGQFLKEKNITAKLLAVVVMLIGIVIPLIWG